MVGEQKQSRPAFIGSVAYSARYLRIEGGLGQLQAKEDEGISACLKRNRSIRNRSQAQ